MAAIGFPGAGVGGNLNLDVGGGIGGGLPELGLGGGIPGWGGWAGPYIPVTPLGALEGIKGDLIVPIVAIGVALFLLVLIVMAVKYALAWKLSVLEDLAGPKKWRRDIGSAAAPQLENDYLNQLAKLVTSAIYSGSCSDRMICEVGAFARGNAKTVNGLVTLVDSYVPSSYHSYLDILKTAAEGSFDCAQMYQCGQGAASTSNSTTPTSAMNKVSPQMQTTPRPRIQDLFNASATNEIRPAGKMGKFRRNLM